MAKVLLVDDHQLVLEGLKAVFQRNPDLQVIGEASTGEEAVQKALTLEPDIVVMDIRLPDISGIEACREIKAHKPGTQVIMLTSYADEEAVFASIIAGAAGYVLKQVRNQGILQAVETVSRGEALLDPSVTMKVLSKIKRMALMENDHEMQGLSNQEKKVLVLVAEGKSNREIAKLLFLSEKTVRNYVSSILNKLNLENRAQIIAYSYKNNLMNPNPKHDY